MTRWIDSSNDDPHESGRYLVHYRTIYPDGSVSENTDIDYYNKNCNRPRWNHIEPEHWSELPPPPPISEYELKLIRENRAKHRREKIKEAKGKLKEAMSIWK